MLVGPSRTSDDLVAPVRGQAVHDQRLRGAFQQLARDRIGAEGLASSLGLLLLAHRGPDVRVDGVGAHDARDGVMPQLDPRAGARGDVARPADDRGIRLDPRAHPAHVEAQGRGGEQQRGTHVVAIPDENQLRAREPTRPPRCSASAIMSASA